MQRNVSQRANTLELAGADEPFQAPDLIGAYRQLMARAHASGFATEDQAMADAIDLTLFE